ncbi:MAG: N-acetylmuramoyl-L-alanine amidase [Bacteroidales bacterium]|jgi:N-acetylmuramoyl-L-alanine amidase|nr:N-acetylmuramoyl-L-alanine amidase [Bacteroidales bacterium]
MKQQFFTFIFIIFITFGLYAQKNGLIDKIVIDAGHGGDKPGAIGYKAKEKDITLDVALKLGTIIKENLKNVEVLFTRTSDKDVELYKRSQVANKNNADLFISIHCNSSTNHESKGFETFAMGFAKTAQNIAVAKKENADILSEANYQKNYEGFDPNAPENNILFSLYQTAYMENSLKFADMVQKELAKNTTMHDRGVKQANFVVLYQSAMPSVLIEIGFISNRQEEVYLMSEKGQYEIAASIFRAICEYKNSKEVEKITIPPIKHLIPDSIYNVKQKEIANTDSVNKDKPVYRVQILSDPEKIDLTDKRFSVCDSVWCYAQNGVWKYTAGAFEDRNKAWDYQKILKEKGFVDAFVVVFYKGKRITFEEANKLNK